MSSIDITSTNDMTSTAAGSTATNSFATDAAQHVTHTLTTDAIIKECIKQGFYRNPICNEKLYLHNRGFDSIATSAFTPYTDVKVLWLEGNGFSALPCGAGTTQVQPPIRVDPFADVTEGASEEKESDAVVTEDPSHPHHHVDPTSMDAQKGPITEKLHAAVLPLPADVPEDKQDAFSSLYPTVRQLYLHNNLFRTMPDLSRFQRLDSVNLSGNFFSAVESHCIYWDAKKAAEAETEADPSPQPEEEAANKEEMTESFKREKRNGDDVAFVPSAGDAKAQRAAQLERYRHLADTHAVLCEHCPLPEREEEADATKTSTAGPYIPRQPPMPDPEYRNPCSSLRNLNLASNRLETFEDCLGLLSYKALAVLDLSHNNIVDGEALLLLLERMPRLQSLKLSGNPLVRTLPRYRKRLLSRCKKLVYLDDRPVFDEERRLVTAWARAGDDGEEKERRLIQQEKAAAEKKRLDDFRRLIARHHDDANPNAPHGDYVRAITTTAALSAAADTGNTGAATTAADAAPPGDLTAMTQVRSHATRAHRPSRRSHRRNPEGRRPSSDPDNSPTSSETDDEDDDGDEVVQHERRHGATAAAAMSDVIAPTHENTNKPTRPPHPSRAVPARVLSSNQRITPDAAPLDGAAGGADEDTDDIFVP